MPELPEVEVTRLSFADRIAGARIEAVRLGKPLRWPLGCAPESLVGRVVRSVERRGKYLLLRLDAGCLLLHLGMSGSLRFEGDLPPAGAHDHFDLVTGHGQLRLHDPRRFGAVVFADGLDDPRAVKLLGGLGVEALFRAGIRPTLRADRISRPRAQRLHAAIVEVLRKALALGGSTLRDFSSARGESGYFQLDAMVYDRAGLPCRVCGTPVRSIRQGQRSTFYCPNCQKA